MNKTWLVKCLNQVHGTWKMHLYFDKILHFVLKWIKHEFVVFWLNFHITFLICNMKTQFVFKETEIVKKELKTGHQLGSETKSLIYLKLYRLINSVFSIWKLFMFISHRISKERINAGQGEEKNGWAWGGLGKKLF